jgi:hypothetical protein
MNEIKDGYIAFMIALGGLLAVVYRVLHGVWPH